MKVEMNKSVYLGLCILDLSKIVMYEFHYDYMKSKYGHKAKLMYTVTDSLVYHIETGDFFSQYRRRCGEKIRYKYLF